VREDGAYVDAGENDNLIVQKIEANPKAIGVFGFSYLEENTDKLKGLPMTGVMPTYATIADFTYPGARPLYIYVKKAHLKAIPGIAALCRRMVTRLWGKNGVLAKAGMVVAPEAVLAASAKAVTDMPLLDGAQLQVRTRTGAMSPAISFLLAFGLGLVGWLSARSRAWAFRRAAPHGRINSLPNFHAWYVALWITVPALLFALLWDTLSPALVLQHVLADPAADALPAFGFERESMMAEARAVATGAGARRVQPGGRRASRTLPCRARALWQRRPRRYASHSICRRRASRSFASGPISPRAPGSSAPSWRCS